jgi:hypothetical protein
MLYILILAISAVAQYFGPWWAMPIVCFVLCAWKSESAKGAYGIAFAAISSLWLGYALFIDNATAGVMTKKMTDLFFKGLPYNALLFTATAVLGGTVAGFAGMAGYLCREAFMPKTVMK